MAHEWLLLGALALPFSIGISIIIATYYYNKNYYLKTKIEYLKLKLKLKELKE